MTTIALMKKTGYGRYQVKGTRTSAAKDFAVLES